MPAMPPARHGKDAMTPLAELATRRRLSTAILLLLPVVFFSWAYWPTFLDLANAWSTNPQYSHGYLVPLFALYLLYLRRDRLDLSAWTPSWWGLPLLALGLSLRLFGAFFYFVGLDGLSVVPTLAGICLLLGGQSAWRWAWPSILFAGFAIPMPYRLASALSGPLQRLATLVSTFVMQTIGLPALAEGNVILLDEYQIGIVEACSGLNMMVVFFALSTAVALLIQRPLLDRMLILASAAPIAVASNIARITITGILYRTTSSEAANAFFHDLAGWLMMPLALVMLWIELLVLERLFLPVTETGKAPRPQTPATREAARGSGSVPRSDRNKHRPL
jgi:exosortase